MSLLLGLLAPQGATLPTVPVTMQFRATRMPLALEALGKAGGVSLRAAPGVANEIVVVDVKGIPLSTVLVALAKAASAKWEVDTDGTFQLSPDAAVRNAEGREALAGEVAKIRASIGKALERAKPKAIDPKATKEEREEIEMENEMAAVGRELVVERILDKIDPAVLAGSERVVFSTRPTRAQRPMPPGSDALLADYVRRANELAGRGTPDETNEFMDKMPEAMKEMIARQTRAIGQPARALLVVENIDFLGGRSAKLRLYDGAGKSLREVSALLGNGMMERIMESAAATAAAKAGGKKPVAAPVKTTPIPLWDDTKKFEAMLKGRNTMMGMGEPVASAPADSLFMARVMRTDVLDPLAFRPTDKVRALARAAGRPLVAVLPDDEMDRFAGALAGENSVEEARKALDEGTSDLRDLKDPTMLLIGPARPAESRAERVDRVDLARLLAAAERDGTVGLDETAAYAVGNPDPTTGGVGTTYVMSLAPGAYTFSMEGMPDWELLRMWGHLSPSMREMIGKGGETQFSLLPPGAKAALVRHVYSGKATFSPVAAAGNVDKEPFWTKMMSGFGGGGDLSQEPTEAVPGGLAPSAPVRALVTQSPSFGMAAKGGGRVEGVMGIAELGMMRFMADDKNMSVFMAPMMDRFSDLRQGVRRNIDLQVLVAPGVVTTGSLKDDRIGKDARKVAFNNLPEDLKKLVAIEAEKVKKSPMGAMGAFMGMGQNQERIRP